MAVIKAINSSTSIKEAIVLDLGDLSRQGERLKSAAQDRAAKIMDEGRQEARRLRSQATQEGYESGHKTGYQEGLAQGREAGHAEALKETAGAFANLQKTWTAAAAKWEEERIVATRQAHQAVLELALKIAAKVTHRAIAVDPQVVSRQLTEALAFVLTATDLTIRIHPSDRPVMEETMPRLLAELGQAHHVRLTDDDQMSRGGCIVTHGQGTIDASIETQLSRLAELVLPGEEERRTATDAKDAKEEKSA